MPAQCLETLSRCHKGPLLTLRNQELLIGVVHHLPEEDIQTHSCTHTRTRTHTHTHVHTHTQSIMLFHDGMHSVIGLGGGGFNIYTALHAHIWWGLYYTAQGQYQLPAMVPVDVSRSPRA